MKLLVLWGCAMIKKYYYKIVECGDFTEVYAYEDENTKVERPKISDLENEEQIQRKQEIADMINNSFDESETEYKRLPQNIQRIKRDVKRLVFANVNQYDCTDKFITLTFAENEKYELTRERVLGCFKRFKERFKKIYGNNFEYIAIIERGTKGTQRLHIHLVAFNLPYINKKKLAEIWQYGFLTINQTQDTDGAVDYILKYLEKTLEDNYIEKGKRFYFTSRGLKKPKNIYLDDFDFQLYMETHDVGMQLYNVEFSSEFVGNCYYTKYKKITVY